MNIPNVLTIIRIFLIPAFILIFCLPFRSSHLVATSIFVLAAITDWLDGYLARNLNQITALGSFLDPVADKIMIVSALVFITGEFGALYVTIPAAIIIGREIVISALREWMAELGKRASVAVGFVGKIKTAVQMISLILLLLYTPHSKFILKFFGIFLLYIAALLTIWSMFMYIKIAWPDLTASQQK